MRRRAAKCRKTARSLACRHLLVMLIMLPAGLWAREPATLYMLECQGCHLADGGGGLNNIPALNDHVARFLGVPGGREYLVQVPGVALSSLSDQEVTDVLNWMLATFGPEAWARRYAPYTVGEVSVLRKTPLSDVGKKRAELLLLLERPEPTGPPG